MMLRLREACGADRDFFRSLYVHVRGEQAGWSLMPEAVRHGILENQFALQIAAYDREYPDLTRYVLVQAGEPIGRLDVARRDDAMHVLELAMLAPFRKLGYGSHVVRQLQAEAAATGKGISLHVWHESGAMAFYQKLGFECVEQGTLGNRMQWCAEGGLEREFSETGWKTHSPL